MQQQDIMQTERNLTINVSEGDNFFINLNMVDTNTWSQTQHFLCSPSNPQGSIASKEYLEKLYEISLRYNFIIMADECYSEIYRTKHRIALSSCRKK